MAKMNDKCLIYGSSWLVFFIYICIVFTIIHLATTAFQKSSRYKTPGKKHQMGLRREGTDTFSERERQIFKEGNAIHRCEQMTYCELWTRETKRSRTSEDHRGRVHRSGKVKI